MSQRSGIHRRNRWQCGITTGSGVLALCALVLGYGGASSTASAMSLGTPGTMVQVSAQFGGANASDSADVQSFVDLTSPSFAGEAEASARYHGPLRVRADSAPDGIGASNGDSMTARAEQTTLYSVAVQPGGLAPGTLVDLRMTYQLSGRMVNIGSSGSSAGSIAYNIQLGTENGSGSNLLDGFMAFGPNSVTANTFGSLNPNPPVDIITGNSFVDVLFADHSDFQAEVGEMFSIEGILQTVSGGTMRSSFLNTASFEITVLTPDVEIAVVPVPEPSSALLLGLGLALLVKRREA